MRRILVLGIITFLFSASLASEELSYSSLVPKTAKSMAMGGVFSSVPTSEFSFFGNPAAFAAQKTTVVLPSFDAWIYAAPKIETAAALIGTGGDMNSLFSTLLGGMAENGGATGGGFSTGLGFAGKGLGLGLYLTSENSATGTSSADARARSETEVSGIIGLGAPIKLGALELSIGGDLRPFYRVSLHDKAYGDIDVEGLLHAMAASDDLSSYLYADSFFGLAGDLGASLELGSLTFGLSIRDIAPSYPMATTSLYLLERALSSGGFVDASSSSRYATFLPDIAVGLSWEPKLLPGFIDPAFYLELQDPIAVAQDWEGFASVLDLVHVGAEIKLLSFLYLRGGLNQGWLSYGVGVKLLFIDLDAAVFTGESGFLAGEDPRSGIAIQAAIRF